jgi:pyrrolidone-carboxylate peptidase/lysophospholipase L1-like esterase
MKRLLLLGLVLLAFRTTAAEPVVLLTGFEPFGGSKTNMSWESVKFYQGKTIAGHRVETLQLPVVYDAVEAPLKEALAKFKPAAILSFGEGSRVVQIETSALNGYHSAKPRDNKNQPPPREKIAPEGTWRYDTGLPAETILKALTAAKIDAALSRDAGGYLCNECFYRMMSLKDAPVRRGFIHLPVLSEKFTAELGQRAVKIAVETTLAAPDKPPFRILALGDSYTVAEGIEPVQGFPAQLALKLKPGATGSETPKLAIIAKTGWTTQNLLRAVDAVKPEGPFDLVTLLIGVNNQFQGRDEKEYREQFVELLNWALAAAGKNPKRVAVISIPDYAVTPFAADRDRAKISAAIDRFNAINKEESAKLAVHYIDITPGSRKAEKEPDLLAPDGLHPSGKMYAQWAEAIHAAVKAEFNK